MLFDNYLAVIARDPNLSVTKFQVLVELLPENVRSCDDGIYRAIDTYLKVIRLFLILLSKGAGRSVPVPPHSTSSSFSSLSIFAFL
ncbi:hypothetical protein RIF29_28277 [Crotalaria pallida]|uniref:NPH3 domain-containing protein n=1 Tax=Crotalaria pallida TaxID=3830 RepID=A0AAN9I181_CROPI